MPEPSREPSPESSSTPTFPSPPPEPLGNTIFIGQDGLRSGWSLLLFGLFSLTLAYAGQILVQIIGLANPRSPQFVAMVDLVSFASAYVAALVMARLEHRPAGVYGLSNELLDTPWPKLVRVKERFQRWLAQADGTAADLLALLADRAQAPETGSPLPTGGLPREWERILSAPFVLNPTYGTRCSTVLLLERDGALHVGERRFDSAGEPAGETRYSLSPGEWP